MISHGITLALLLAGGNEPMRRPLSILLLAVLALSGRPFAAPDDRTAAQSPNVSVTSATLSINGTSTMHPYTVSTKSLQATAALATANDLRGLL
jgi:hypothetical protein